MTTPALTLDALLAEKEFRLTLVAGARRTQRPVEGIHLSELDDPTPWMLPKSLLLSTGANIDDDPSLGARLVETLVAADMAGLGISLGHSLQALPPTMVERAEELGLPLFTVPLDMAFRRITAYVYNALTSQDMYRLRRSLSLQSHLLELLIEERGLEELIANLAVLLDTTVLLFDGQGALLSEATHQARLSAQAHRAVWDAYLEHRGSPQLNQTIHVSGFRISYREATLHGHIDRVLVAAYANRPIPELAETTLSFAQKLLTLDRLRERDVLALHHRMRTALMDDLVSGIGTERELDQRMRQYGLDAERPYRVAALVAEDPPAAATGDTAGRAASGTDPGGPQGDLHPASRAHDEERILRFTSSFQESVDDFLSRHGLAYLTVPKGDAIVVLVQFLDPAWTEAERTISALADAVERTLTTTRLRVGVSGPASGPVGARGAFQQAREAADMAGGRRRANRVRFFDQLHPQNRLLEAQSVESLRAIYDETVAPLVEHDRRRRSDLRHTLEVYLTEDRSITRAATTLHMHRNTLNKRLERIEGLLGLNLSSTDDLVALRLGLRAYEMLDGGDG